MNDQNCLFEEYEEIKPLLRIGNLMVGKYQKKEEVAPSSFELYGMMLKDIENGNAGYLKSKKEKRYYKFPPSNPKRNSRNVSRRTNFTKLRPRTPSANGNKEVWKTQEKELHR